MCNAHNHWPGCTCGWGGNGGGGPIRVGRLADLTPSSRSSSSSGASSSVASPAKAAVSNQPPHIRDSVTHGMLCWWCGAPVFYHTNGYGDCVLFDSLGYPWQVHSCWADYWNGQKSIRRGLANTRFPDNVSRILERIGTYEQSGRSSTYRDLKGTPHQEQHRDQRMAVLVGAITRSRFIPTEKTVAQRLGLTVVQLKVTYGDLYTLDPMAKELCLVDVEKIDVEQSQPPPITSHIFIPPQGLSVQQPHQIPIKHRLERETDVSSWKIQPRHRLR